MKTSSKEKPKIIAGKECLGFYQPFSSLLAGMAIRCSPRAPPKQNPNPNKCKGEVECNEI